MDKLTHWIKSHQVTAFFVLAYAITWLGLLIAYYVFPGNLAQTERLGAVVPGDLSDVPGHPAPIAIVSDRM